MATINSQGSQFCKRNKIMRFLVFLTLFISTNLVIAQDSISVLFIGNSYTYYNDLPGSLSSLATSLGDEVTVDSKSNGGFTFQNQLDDPLTQTKIELKPWDFVILQGQSQEPSFPYDQVNSATLPPAVALADSVYANSYCSQVMYFMTWGRQVGDPQWDSINTFDKMNLRLRNAYVRIADSAEASVSPVGIAWKYVRDNYPTINLYNADGSHPSIEGTYLAACTFYASTFRKSPVGATFTLGLDATTAGILQNAAEIAVLDSLETWHLRPKDEISLADFHFDIIGNTVQFTNDSWRSTDYEWNFGDGNTSSMENPQNTYLNTGTYSVELIASSECGDDTISYELEIIVGGINGVSNSVLIKKTKGSGIFEIQGFEDSELDNLTLLNANGSVINSEEIVQKTPNTVLIDLSSFEDGFYFLKVSGQNSEIIVDLPVFK